MTALPRHRLAGLTLFVAAVVYAAWLVPHALGMTELSLTHSYVSELAAKDQPLTWVFRSTDLVGGMLVVAGSVLALARRDPHRVVHRSEWVGWTALAGFGTATVVDVIFPMSCAESLDASCRAASVAGQLPLSDTIHLVSSSLAGLLLATSALLAWSYRSSGLVTAGAVLLVLSTAVAITAGLHEFAEVTFYPGAFQRGQLLWASIWLGLLGVACWSADSASIGVDPPHRTRRADPLEAT